ncbi:hypothetical protein M2284_001652, partial [Rhodococcus sp. LBL1]|nr:hypothetical protein [Rhodococcus sp. LBL1]
MNDGGVTIPENQRARRRGELRIYLGAAPGVGKTYAMLGEAHRRRERGGDVVAGGGGNPPPAPPPPPAGGGGGDPPPPQPKVGARRGAGGREARVGPTA